MKLYIIKYEDLPHVLINVGQNWFNYYRSVDRWCLTYWQEGLTEKEVEHYLIPINKLTALLICGKSVEELEQMIRDRKWC